MSLFRAPAAARAAKTLDRSLFSQTWATAVAAVRDNRLLSQYRKSLEKTRELLYIDKLNPIITDPDPIRAAEGKKCLILRPEVNPTKPETWSPMLQEASRTGDVRVIPWETTIGYNLWSYLDVVRSILPEELHEEIPVGFNIAGHVAHLNLRDQYLPFKNVIADVIVDKNPQIRTVIRKTDNVGAENEFRTFSYEVLAGPDDMLVEVSQDACTFKFDYSKVYWNSKLSTEHQRITSCFKPGEVVADVMAGIGPFAVPAGRKGVFVWANDKNPESYKYLQDSIKGNKVEKFVRPFNRDGHDFIRDAADLVLEASRRGDCAIIPPPKPPRSKPQLRQQPTRIPIPPTISHFVMNLPASAVEFLHNYRGLYHGHSELFYPSTTTRLPLIHVHCFAVKADDATPLEDICQRIFQEIGIMLTPGDPDKEGHVHIHDVRDVAPAKRMFCASFRLPSEVAFASRT